MHTFPFSRSLPPLLFGLLLLPVGCVVTVEDDDAADDDTENVLGDDDSTADDDTAADDDTYGGDDDGAPDDPCKGVEWEERGGEDWDVVQPGLVLTAADVLGRIDGFWHGAVAYSVGTGDGEAQLDVEGEGDTFLYRADNGEGCQAALRIFLNAALATPTCTFASSAVDLETSVAGNGTSLFVGWSENWFGTASGWVPDFDPAEWDDVTLSYSFYLSEDKGGGVEPILGGDIVVNGSRTVEGEEEGEGEGAVGEGFVEPVAHLDLAPTDAPIPEEWGPCM